MSGAPTSDTWHGIVKKIPSGYELLSANKCCRDIPRWTEFHTLREVVAYFKLVHTDRS